MSFFPKSEKKTDFEIISCRIGLQRANKAILNKKATSLLRKTKTKNSDNF